MKKILVFYFCLLISACAGIQHQDSGISEMASDIRGDVDQPSGEATTVEESLSDERLQADAVQAPSEEGGQPEDRKPLWPTETGYATYYAANMEGLATASGEAYDAQQLTAAHRTIPLGSIVRVTNPATQQHVTVRINDRWGGGGGRIINLSRQAAIDLGFGSSGTIFVHLDVESIPSGGDESGMMRPVPLPERISDDGTKQHSKLSICQNEAEILGLTGDFFRYHVLGCLSRSK